MKDHLARRVAIQMVLVSLFCLTGSAQTTAPVIVTQAYAPEYWEGPSVQKRNIVVGQDGFARFVIDGTDPNTFLDKIWLIRCLDVDCATSNATLVVSGIWRNNGSSLALGNDGFPKIVYVDNQEVLHFVQCTDSDCSSSVQTTPLLSPDEECNTGSPDYTPIPGRYCAAGEVSLVFIGSNGLPEVLFDWQDNYDQNISLSVASCHDAACATVTVTTVAEVINEDIISGSMVLGLDGYPRVVYVDQSTTSYPQSGTVHLVQCIDLACSGETDAVIGTTSSAYSADVAVGSDGFGRAVFEDVSRSQVDFVQCTGGDCSTNNQSSFSVQFSSPYATFNIGVGTDGNPGIAVMGADNVDYVACTTASCSSYDLEQMPSEVAGAIAGMAFGLDGLPSFVGWDSDGMVDYMYQKSGLSCSTPVTRGSAGKCEVTGVSGITGWKFVDSNGNPVQRSTNTTSPTWSGTMVTDGTVSVTISGTSDRTANIKVTARNWHIDPASTADQKPNGYFYTLPVPPQPTGADAGLGHYRFIANRSGSATQAITDNGPNHGYTYFTQPITFTTGNKVFEYEINPDLENQSSDFSIHQCELDGYISWQHLYDGTRRHEFNSDTDSHYAKYKQAWNAYNGGDYVEKQVAVPGRNVGDWLDSIGSTLNDYYNTSGTIASLTAAEPSPINEINGQDLLINFKNLETGTYPHSCP